MYHFHINISMINYTIALSLKHLCMKQFIIFKTVNDCCLKISCVKSIFSPLPALYGFHISLPTVSAAH